MRFQSIFLVWAGLLQFPEQVRPKRWLEQELIELLEEKPVTSVTIVKLSKTNDRPPTDAAAIQQSGVSDYESHHSPDQKREGKHQ